LPVIARARKVAITDEATIGPKISRAKLPRMTSMANSAPPMGML
jgi:hypothetical protein